MSTSSMSETSSRSRSSSVNSTSSNASTASAMSFEETFGVEDGYISLEPLPYACNLKFDHVIGHQRVRFDCLYEFDTAEELARHRQSCALRHSAMHMNNPHMFGHQLYR